MVAGHSDTQRDSYQYAVFGRPVRSTVRLPRLRPRETVSQWLDDRPIRVRRARLSPTPDAVPRSLTRVHEDPDGKFAVYEADDGALYWFYDGVGVLRVDDTDVALSPAPSATAEAYRRLVRGPGLRSVLVRRGAVVVHASAVAIDGRAVAFTGPSGRGKSTTAGACLAAGHDLLVDDVLPITLCAAADGDDGRPVAPVGAPSLRLDARAAGALGFDARGSDEAAVDVGDRLSTAARPLAAVYLLADGEDVAIDRVPSQQAVFELLRSSYALYDDGDRAAVRRHLDDCGTLAERVSVRRLTRPRSLDALDDLADAVAADVRRLG